MSPCVEVCVVWWVTSVTQWLKCASVCVCSHIFKSDCVGLLIWAFELTGLCCGQPGAPNSVVQRLCLQVQVAALREVRSDERLLGEFLLVSVLGHVHIWGCIYVCCTLCVFWIL